MLQTNAKCQQAANGQHVTVVTNYSQFIYLFMSARNQDGFHVQDCTEE